MGPLFLVVLMSAALLSLVDIDDPLRGEDGECAVYAFLLTSNTQTTFARPTTLPTD